MSEEKKKLCTKEDPCQDCRKFAQEKLAKLEDWEVKRKEALENLDLEKETECAFCPNKDDSGNRVQYSSAGDFSLGYSIEPCPECSKEDALFYQCKSNHYGDKLKKLTKQECNCHLQLDNQIKSNQIKSNQIKSNQIKSNQIKSNQLVENEAGSNSPKTNYLPWVLGGIGIVALIGGLIWYFSKRNNK